MIDYIRGTLAYKSVTTATVEAHGVGYEISISVSTFEKLPNLGEQVKLVTHFHVREDTQRLFGFVTDSERSLFRQLIGVSQVGPKVALNVMSGVSVRDFVAAVNTGNDSRLRSIPGVGPKTAQRLVMELKGKVGPIDAGLSAESGDAPVARSSAGGSGSVRKEAYEAMMSLGYIDKQVQSALSRVEKVVEKDAPVEEWIRKALQVI
jgi:Holliday junction DNA helicase RuvA